MRNEHGQRRQAWGGAVNGAVLTPRRRRIAASDRETELALIGGPGLLRAAIGELIDAQPGLRVACSVASIEALEETCRLSPPRCDVALLDVDDYRGGCARAVDRLLALGLGCKLVLLCAEASGEMVSCASSRRIDGVVLKEASVGELCEAVAHILTGPRRDAGPLACRPRAGGADAAPERGAASLIAHGYSNEEIADKLGVRPNTVKFHISEIFRRLGVRNRIEAIARLSERDADRRPRVRRKKSARSLARNITRSSRRPLLQFTQARRLRSAGRSSKASRRAASPLGRGAARSRDPHTVDPHPFEWASPRTARVARVVLNLAVDQTYGGPIQAPATLRVVDYVRVWQHWRRHPLVDRQHDAAELQAIARRKPAASHATSVDGVPLVEARSSMIHAPSR